MSSFVDLLMHCNNIREKSQKEELKGASPEGLIRKGNIGL